MAAEPERGRLFGIIEDLVRWENTALWSHDMVCHMKTTLNIADSVMQRLREEAARRGTTMSALVEAGLRRLLAEPSQSDAQPAKLPPLPAWNGGGELVDLSDRDALYRAMEEE